MVTSTHISVRQMHLPITSLLTSCVSLNKLTDLASLFPFEKRDADTSMVESLQGVNDLMYANCLVVTCSFTHVLFWPGTQLRHLSYSFIWCVSVYVCVLCVYFFIWLWVLSRLPILPVAASKFFQQLALRAPAQIMGVSPQPHSYRLQTLPGPQGNVPLVFGRLGWEGRKGWCRVGCSLTPS